MEEEVEVSKIEYSGVTGVSIIAQESTTSLQIIVEGLGVCANEGDLQRGVSHYVRLLNRHLSLKYKIPSKELNLLVETLYSLISWPDLDAELQGKWAKTLTKLLR
jgi:hypothetical protein